ncbi:hypothetical protein BVC80_1101g30 [Macleaya cordata]|uniref:Uncharacterized protein n=1 Tax=Macleaya cordata TaxID=56857 RepID=A0A200QCK1_MACCD|nr:hypothetical protein BVC80_1101g30 [Macleaya cordata]
MVERSKNVDDPRVVEFALKLIGISAPDFILTNKVRDNEQQKSWGIIKMIMRDGKLEEMFIQLFISGFVMLNAWPIYEAMVLRKDGGRMPTRVTLVSIFLTWVLYYGASILLQ